MHEEKPRHAVLLQCAHMHLLLRNREQVCAKAVPPPLTRCCCLLIGLSSLCAHHIVQPVVFFLQIVSHWSGCVMFQKSLRRLVPATSTPNAHQSLWSSSRAVPVGTHARWKQTTSRHMHVRTLRVGEWVP